MNNEEMEYYKSMKEAYYCTACGAINEEDCICDELYYEYLEENNLY